MRPIDADALKETIDNIWNGRPLSFLGARILATIDHAPTIEPSKSRPFGDCAKCIHIYGTLGCCSTVNNEWVYDCDYGMAQYKENKAEPRGDLISREDAIEVVCRTRCGDKAKGCPAHSCPVIEEFDALTSAETHEIRTETHGVCSDFISRADVLALINKAMFSIDNRGMQDYIFNGLRREVHNLPSAGVVNREDYHNLLMATNDIDRALRKYQAKEETNADRPKGEWKTNNIYKGLVFCDECGMSFRDSLRPRNYCPNCGADMRPDK